MWLSLSAPIWLPTLSFWRRGGWYSIMTTSTNAQLNQFDELSQARMFESRRMQEPLHWGPRLLTLIKLLNQLSSLSWLTLSRDLGIFVVDLTKFIEVTEMWSGGGVHGHIPPSSSPEGKGWRSYPDTLPIPVGKGMVVTDASSDASSHLVQFTRFDQFHFVNQSNKHDAQWRRQLHWFNQLNQFNGSN